MYVNSSVTKLIYSNLKKRYTSLQNKNKIYMSISCYRRTMLTYNYYFILPTALAINHIIPFRINWLFHTNLIFLIFFLYF